MPITNRNLPAGTVLAGRYKGQTYHCTVLEHEGKLAFTLDDDSIHPSLSAAASKVMGGVSANGWRFWSPETELVAEGSKPPRSPKLKAAAEPTAAKMIKVIKKLPNQKGVVRGQHQVLVFRLHEGLRGGDHPHAGTVPGGAHTGSGRRVGSGAGGR